MQKPTHSGDGARIGTPDLKGNRFRLRTNKHPHRRRLYALNKHLRELWRNAGYPAGMGSAAVVPPPPTGYRRVYYLTTADHAISNIAFSRIKVARFESLNDPFELLAPKFRDKSSRSTIGEFKRNFGEENGLLCFSANWTAPVLWSHYGAKHRGICLGFNVKEAILRDVDYVSSRIVHDLVGGTVDARFADLILKTKFESWKYEKERRVLVPLQAASREGDFHFVSFDDEIALAEVIVGALCPLSAKRARGMVNKHQVGVVTIKARLALKSYHIVPMESTVPAQP